MADETVNVEGLKELKAVLDKLPGRLGDKTILAALRAAAQVIRKDAQARAPVLAKANPRRKSGTLRNAITVRKSKREKYGVYVGIKPLSKKKLVAFRRAAGFGKKGKGANNPDDPFYWIFMEFGTAKFETEGFLRPAFEANKFAALRRFEEFAKRRIKKEADKLARELGSRAA